MNVNPELELGVLADLLFFADPWNRTTGFISGRPKAYLIPHSEIFGQALERLSATAAGDIGNWQPGAGKIVNCVAIDSRI